MRSLRRLLLTACCAVWALSCTDSGAGPMDEEAPGLPDLSGLPVSSSVIEGDAPAVCGVPTEVGLMLGPDVTTGTVTVANTQESLYVTYRSAEDRPILATALFVGDSPSEIPVTRWGTPRLFRFPYLSGHDVSTYEVVWEVPLTDVNGGEAVIAAFGQIGVLPSWGDGEPITEGRDWAMYFTHTLANCGAETIGPEGGTVSSPDGNVRFDVPANALLEEVAITIEPATFEEVQARVEEILGGTGYASQFAAVAEAAASASAQEVRYPGGTDDASLIEPLPTLAGVIRPIENTFWDFGPDGLEFLESATVTLTYRDEDLPPDVSEEELGVFVINGVIPYDRVGVVDPIANTITAPVDHFSYFFVGYLDPILADLGITASVLNDNEPAGTEVDFAPTVSNAGPEGAPGVTITYQGFGNLTLGSYDSTVCQEIAPIVADVALTCEVGDIAANDALLAPSAAFVAQVAGEYEVWIRPNLARADVNTDNDLFQYTFTAVDPTPQADLSIVSATESADPIEVGLGVTYTATIESFGPGDAPDVSVYYGGFGDVAVGAIGEGCTIVPVPVIVDVQVACTVGALAASGSAEASPVEFVPGSTGEYTIWIEPFSVGTTDPVTENNRLEETVTVAGRTADLQIQAVGDNPDPAPEGTPVEYLISVVAAANAQPVESAHVVLAHAGAATFVTASDEACTTTASAVRCPVPPLPEGLIQEISITLLPNEGLEELVVLATINEPFGVFEVDESNNTQPEVTTIDLGLPDVDLSIVSATESADPIEVGLGVTYTATLRSFGPAEASEVSVRYSAFGDVAVGAMGEGCTVVPIPVIVDVSVDCPVGTIPPSTTVVAAPVEFIPATTGDYTIWIEPFSLSTTDPVVENNRLEESVTVEGRTADLQIQYVNDTPDPAPVGSPVEYAIAVVSDAAQTIESANFVLNHSGNATFVSSSLEGCVALANSVTCPVGPLPDGLIQEFSITLQPDEGLSELLVLATINEPAGVFEVDESNNTQPETTTIDDRGTPTDGVDLAMTSFTGPTAPLVLGESFSVNASFENIGTATASDVVFRYLLPSAVSVAAVPSGCALAPSPIFADIEVLCGYPSVASGASVNVPALGLTAVGLGTINLSGLAFVADDADPANNQAETSVTVNAGEADLSIERFVDAPDPVQPGDLITYEVDVGLAGTAPVSDGRLRLSFTGDADFVSASVGCSQSPTNVWNCILDPIDPGVPQTVQLQYLATTGGSTITVDAEVFSLGSTTDPNSANNTATTSTTVESVGAVPITKGDVIEEILPAGGSSALFGFSGTAGEQVRIGLAMLSGPNPTGELRVLFGNDTILGGDASLPLRATELSSRNEVITLPATGDYVVSVESFGSGFFRLGLGTELGRGDLTYGDAGRIYRRVAGTSSSEQYLLDIEAVGSGILAFGSRHLTLFDATGQFDPSFGIGGEVDLATVYAGPARAFAIQPDGRIVVVFPAFTFPYPWIVARFNADGTVDTGFGTNGLTQVQVGSGASQLSVQPHAIGFIQDGVETDIVVAGRSASNSDQVGILRLNSDGSPETGFGTGGVVTDNLGFAPTTAAIQPDGRILVGDADQLARYTSSGALDSSFGGSGLVGLPAAGVVKIIPLAGGDIIGVGESADDALVVRLNANGSPAAFGSGGAVLLDFGLEERLQDVVEDGSGNLILAGYEITPGGRYDQLLVRLTGSGLLDGIFGHGGFTVEGSTLDDGRAVTFDSQGAILVGGMGRNAFGLTISRHLVN